MARDSASTPEGCTPPPRLPHATFDLYSRRLKGLKIERLLNLVNHSSPIRMLEVGTGSGGIANYFGTHVSLICEVDAVDVNDNRVVTEGYRYKQVGGTELPYRDSVFDVVLSNHVVEHVGNESAQREHLSELRRVLRPNGIGYLAVPNRWMLIEPHYRLIFLSWLPHKLANFYVKSFGKGTHYDCLPLTVSRMESMLADVGFVWRQRHGDALLLTCEIESPDSPVYRFMLRLIPSAVFSMLRRIFPTLIYTVQRIEPSGRSVDGDV